MPRRISRIKFLSIARELRETDLKQEVIALRHYVAQGTVSNVNLAGTWGNYLAHKQLVHPIRKVKTNSVQARYERMKKAGLNPTTRQDRALSREIKTLDHTITRSEFKELERRITIISTQLAGITDTPIVGSILRRRMAKAVQRLPKERE